MGLLDGLKLVEQYSTLLVGALTGLSTYLFTRQKYKAEVKGMEAKVDIDELEATDKAIKIWRDLAEDLGKELHETKKEMREQIANLEKQILILQKENRELRGIIESLK